MRNTLRPPDVVGKKWNRLTVVRITSRNDFEYFCEAICDCGVTKFGVRLNSIRHNGTKSCGCLRDELLVARRRTHGQSSTTSGLRTREYTAWAQAKGRCYNKNNDKYPIYGGRGISMCARWKDSFENFVADVGKAPKGKTLDRINTNGNYEPGNVRWATAKQQANNLRNTVWVLMANGERMTISDIADRTGAKRSRVRKMYEYHGAEKLSELLSPLISPRVRD